jgi:NADH-quinone oxidoreductase subunit I
MYGKGLIKGLGVTFKRYWNTYWEDITWAMGGNGKRYFTPEGVARRSSKDARGIFTIQYPEEKLPVPEEFRYVPFLVYEEGEEGEKNIRCTSCGICSKVCPPQCIWIIRSTDPTTGRPIPAPAEFFIDADICMNCGFCAEFCPFDAIKMDHDYEISSEKRNVLNKSQLMKPLSYYAGIRPLNYAKEEGARAEKAAAKAARAEE